MTRPSAPIAVLRSRGLRPSKKRGQHFLTDRNIAGKIQRAVGAAEDDIIVEIGAGLGALSRGLAERARRVYAVEVDRGVAAILAEDLRSLDNVVVAVEDILGFDLAGVTRREGVDRVKIVGNLPYCITAPILLWIVRRARAVSDAFLMMQMEVAERIAAPPGGTDYGPLTIAVQFWSEPVILFRVSSGCFSPAPGVESAFVRLRMTGEPRITVEDEAFYFDLVRKVFSQRRKMLKNSLLQLEGVNEHLLKTVEARTGVSLRARPQELSLDMFAQLARELGARR